MSVNIVESVFDLEESLTGRDLSSLESLLQFDEDSIDEVFSASAVKSW